MAIKYCQNIHEWFINEEKSHLYDYAKKITDQKKI